MDFDWEFYIEYYEDLKKANINNEKKAIDHWNNHGKNEGRFPNKQIKDESLILKQIRDLTSSKLYYLHIPKCAGTSLYKALLGKIKGLEDTINGNIINNNNRLRWNIFEKNEIEELYKTRNVLFNEFPICNSIDLNLDIIYISIIRNPIDRLISFLQNAYVCNKIEISIDEFANSLISTKVLVDNGILNMFTNNDKMLIEDKLELFYKNSKNFIIFNLDDCDFSKKITHFFKNKFDIDIEISKHHQRYINNESTIYNKKINIDDFNQNSKNLLIDYCKIETECYNYLIENNLYKIK